MSKMNDEQMRQMEAIRTEFAAASYFEAYRRQYEDLEPAVASGDLSAALDRTDLIAQMKRIVDFDDPKVLASHLLRMSATLMAMDMNMRALVGDTQESVDDDVIQ